MMEIAGEDSEMQNFLGSKEAGTGTSRQNENM